MGAAKYNLEVQQGATFSLSCTLKDSTGTPVNLTGWTFAGQIRKFVNSSDIAVSFTITLANQGTNPGEFAISLTPTQTSAIPVGLSEDRKIGHYFYDVEATKPDTTKDRVLEGSVLVSPEVTR